MTCVARHIPHDCHQPLACLRAACRIGNDRTRGEREPLPADTTGLTITPDEWRARQIGAAA